MRPRALAARQLPIDPGRIRIADAAAVLDVARTARDGDREAVLHREDAADLPAAEQRLGDAAAVHVGAIPPERQIHSHDVVHRLRKSNADKPVSSSRS